MVEGNPFPSSGERWVSIHARHTLATSPQHQIRRRYIELAVTLNQRCRNTPNDRWGYLAYLEEHNSSMSMIMDDIIPRIESLVYNANLEIILSDILIPPECVEGGYDPQSPPDNIPPRYQLLESIPQFIQANFDPVHLYPSDFWTRGLHETDSRQVNDKEQLYDKLAGFQMTAVFNSPTFWEPYAGLNGGGTDSENNEVSTCKKMFDPTP